MKNRITKHLSAEKCHTVTQSELKKPKLKCPMAELLDKEMERLLNAAIENYNAVISAEKIANEGE